MLSQPATANAQQWDGFGTALKPSWEPIILARKPLEGTIVANVLKWGTGALNIDACRIGNDTARADRYNNKAALGSDEVVEGFPDAKSGGAKDCRRQHHGFLSERRSIRTQEYESYGDTGSAARFFFTAKASPSDRGAGNTHPTVKPVSLMRWLLRLVVPPGGVALDLFAGSGTTGVAACEEGRGCLLIEQDPTYFAIACQRLTEAVRQPDLFLAPPPPVVPPQQLILGGA
jgi:site-specific DNA-methyltransferase (adenine-specific)